MNAINHAQRLDGVVKAALLQSGFAESFGYYVQFTMLPSPNGPIPGWFVGVFIRDGLAEEPICQGFPLMGMLPPDQMFRDLATLLLSRCREDRDAKNAAAVEHADAELKQITRGR